jgi:hypothetical protein
MRNPTNAPCAVPKRQRELELPSDGELDNPTTAAETTIATNLQDEEQSESMFLVDLSMDSNPIANLDPLKKELLKKIENSNDRQFLSQYLDEQRQGLLFSSYCGVSQRSLLSILPGKQMVNHLLNCYAAYLNAMCTGVWVPALGFMDKIRIKDNAVHRWLRRANKQLRNLDRIVFPVFCESNEHFCCVIIDLKSKRIVLYDSMADVYAKKGTSSVTSREMQMLRQWVSDESAKEPGEQGQWDTTAWEIKRAKCVQQNNGYDGRVCIYST